MKIVLLCIIGLICGVSVHGQCGTVLLPDSLSACNGDVLTMSPIITGAVSVRQVLWRPSQGCSDITAEQPQITVTIPEYYTITVTTSAANLLINGDFSLGDVGFTSQYVSNSPVNCAACIGGTYTVDTTTIRPNPGWLAFGDHTTGTGKFMIINSASTGPLSFWCETIPVTPNTDYTFSGWVVRCNGDAGSWDTTVLNCNINGMELSNIYTARDQAGIWSQFIFNWNSGLDTSATICLSNLDMSLGGNDFAIDDLLFSSGAICSLSDSVYIDVIQSDLFVPTVFTPNNDGQNDYFFPRGSDSVLIRSFTIYNRWGEQMFSKADFYPNDRNNSWDGTFKGRRLETDVFFYKIEIGCGNRYPIIVKGDVTLMR